MSLQGHGDAVRRKTFLKHAHLAFSDVRSLLHCDTTFICDMKKKTLCAALCRNEWRNGTASMSPDLHYPHAGNTFPFRELCGDDEFEELLVMEVGSLAAPHPRPHEVKFLVRHEPLR